MIKRIGVIGAGQMGTGIAHVCALSGLDVRLMDISEDRLDAAMQAMDQNMERQVRRGLFEEVDKHEALLRVQTSTSMADMLDRQMVVEAATEDEAVKKRSLKR